MKRILKRLLDSFVLVPRLLTLYLEIYGWMMNASAHSVEEKDVESVSDILLDNPENTWELYDYFTDNIRDIHEPDLFRNEKPFWYDDDTKFFLFDGNFFLSLFF